MLSEGLVGKQDALAEARSRLELDGVVAGGNPLQPLDGLLQPGCAHRAGSAQQAHGAVELLAPEALGQRGDQDLGLVVVALQLRELLDEDRTSVGRLDELAAHSTSTPDRRSRPDPRRRCRSETRRWTHAPHQRRAQS